MRGPATVDLRDPGAFATATPARQLLYLVLLLAVKDRASEVRFDPALPGELEAQRIRGRPFHEQVEHDVARGGDIVVRQRQLDAHRVVPIGFARAAVEPGQQRRSAVG